MAQTMTAYFNIGGNFTSATTAISKSFDTVSTQIAKADKNVKNFNTTTATTKKSVNNTTSSVDSLIGKFTALVSTAYLAKKALDLTFSGINTAAVQKVQETTFQALLNSKEAGSNLYKYVGAYAKISALGREDIAKGVTSFLTVTRDMNQVEQLIKMTERLYAKDPTQGAEGAVFALKEALSGDVISLRNRFGITGLSGESLRNGDTTSKIEQIDQALNAFGATQEVVSANYNGLLAQTNIFTSNLKTAIGEGATPVMSSLAQVMVRLNENMEAGKYQPFINLMVNGMSAIGNTLAFVADNANWLIPVIGGVTTSILVCNAAMSIANTVVAIMGITLSTATGNWIRLGAVIAGVAATTALAASAMKNNSVEALEKSVGIDDIKNTAGKTLAGTKLPVEITNSDPVKVTGNVEIEKENLKYWLDMAGKKFFAEFNANTVAPQVNFNNTQITEKVDINEVCNRVGNVIYESSQIQPQGV